MNEIVLGEVFNLEETIRKLLPKLENIIVILQSIDCRPQKRILHRSGLGNSFRSNSVVSKVRIRKFVKLPNSQVFLVLWWQREESFVHKHMANADKI